MSKNLLTQVAVTSSGLSVQFLLNEDISLQKVLAFQFQPLIDRMIDKYAWTRDEAEQVFEDMKRFLYLCGAGTMIVAPSPKIDEMWHNFILYTEDYYVFCKEHFCRFIHHRPQRKTDPVSPRNLVRDTLMIAQVTFGNLSPAWNYTKRDGTVLDANTKFTDKDPSQIASDECGGSTNCQEACSDTSCH